jgi:hypothetical protein
MTFNYYYSIEARVATVESFDGARGGASYHYLESGIYTCSAQCKTSLCETEL